jgi:hypothetical protein
VAGNRTIPNNGPRKQGKWMPTPISGGYSSPKAIFNGSDIARLLEVNDEMRYRTQGTIQLDRRQPSTYHFLNYLGRAVRNHFANFCRTRKRKWQDRSGDAMVGGKKLLGDKMPQFRTENGTYNDHWEDTIRDEIAEGRIEAQVQLSRLIDQLKSKGVQEETQTEIFKLVDEGYTFSEAVQKSSLDQGKKRIVTRLVQNG